MAEIADLSTTDASNTARVPENQAPSSVNNGARSLEGIIARWHKDTNGSLVATGSADAYVLAANQTLTAYYDGLRLCFEANFTNGGTATLNVDSVGAKTIKKLHDQALAAGDIESGQKVDVVFDSDGDCWQLLSQIAATPYADPLTTRGDVLFRNASATTRLAAGTAGYFLQTQGAGADPVWAAVGNVADELARQNLMVLAFRVAITNNLAIGNFLDGRYDQFEDQTGVDDTASTDETYDASNDYYHNPSGTSSLSGATGTNIGDMTGDGGLAAAFDGTTSQAVAASATVTATTGIVGKDYGVNNSYRFYSFAITASNDSGFIIGSNPTVTLSVYGTTDGGTTGGTLLGTDANTDSNGVTRTINSTDTATAFRGFYVTITDGSGTKKAIAEVAITQVTSVANMVLISESFTAETAPDDIMIGVLLDPVDSVTINTDLVAAVSRDGGTTYTNATLVDEGDFDGSYLLLFDTVDVSGQPSGTSPKWRLTVANAKEMRVKAVGLLWS